MIKKFLKKIVFGNKYSSETYINYLRKQGATIGEYTNIYNTHNVLIDETRPWLINIGNNVQITEGVKILTHGFDWSVLQKKYGYVLGSSGKVEIGDNVFIGANTTILKGVTIGNNVIIGANSLVNNSFPDDVVIAGNPARIICTIDEYLNKRLKLQKSEAVELAIEYYDKYGKWPEREVLREFIFLFDNANIEDDKIMLEIGSINGNYDSCIKRFMNTKKEFKNYEEFIDYCKKARNKSFKK